MVNQDSDMAADAFRKLERNFRAQAHFEAPYERALGKLTIRFSLLHISLESFAWDAWGLATRTAHVLTRDLSTQHLVEKLRSSEEWLLYTQKDREDFRGILNRIESVASRRNELVRSLWLIDAGTPVRSFNRKKQAGGNVASVDEINRLSRTITEILADLLAFRERRPLEQVGLGLNADHNNAACGSRGATAMAEHYDTP
jgi:hypothetical protein